MKALMSTFRDLINYNTERKKPARYRSWSDRMKTLTTTKLNPLFKGIKGSSNEVQIKTWIGVICDTLKEMDESSTLDCEYSGDAGDAYIAQARQQLLDLWENLIRCCIDKVSINEVSPIVFSVILWVMKRPEFDLTHLRWDVHRTPMCEHHVVLMEHRYRLLLIDTLELVVKNLDRFAETFQETARDVTDTADNTNESDYETRVDAMGVVGDIMDDCVPQFDDPLRSSSYVTTTPSLSPPPAISPPTSSAASSSLIIKSKTEGLGAGKEIKSLEMIDPLRTSLTSVQKEDNNNNEDGYDDDDYDEDEEEDVDDDEEEEDDETGSTNEQQQAFPVLGDPFFVLPASTMASQYKDRKKQSVQKRKKKKKDIHKKKQQQQQQQQQQPPKTSPPPLQPSPTPQPPSPPDSLYKTLSPSFGIFSAKVLACLFFRYPYIQQEIISAVAEGLNLKENTYGLTKPASMVSVDTYPLLLQWDLFHQSVKKWNNDKTQDTLDNLPKNWLKFISTKEEFFVEFFVEWICFAKHYVTTHGSEWFGIPGYTELTLGYLSLYDLPPGVPRPPAHYFTTCEKILLDTAEPTVFNALIKHKFTHTCIRVVSQLNDCIGVLDAWLAVLARSKIALTGDNFDSKFFGRGVDLLLSSDHHFVVARTLVILYNYSWLFQGDARVEIYEHVVLGRHFYHLFLNWDENVRCIFYQLMLFKLMTCRKRDVLAYEAYLSSVKAAAGNSQLAGSNSGQAVKIQKPRFPKDISPTEVDVAMMHKIDICVGTVVAWKKSHPKEKQSQQSSYSGLVGSARKKTFIVEDPCENPGFADVAIKDDIECSPESHALTSSVVAAVSTSEKKAAENALGDIPPSRCVYVDKALKEYKRHTMRYDEWEAKGVVEIPNLVIVNFRN